MSCVSLGQPTPRGSRHLVRKETHANWYGGGAPAAAHGNERWRTWQLLPLSISIVSCTETKKPRAGRRRVARRHAHVGRDADSRRVVVQRLRGRRPTGGKVRANPFLAPLLQSVPPQTVCLAPRRASASMAAPAARGWASAESSAS